MLLKSLNHLFTYSLIHLLLERCLLDLSISDNVTLELYWIAKKSVCCCLLLFWSGMDWETRKLFGMDWEWSLKLQTWKGEREVAWADRSPVVWLPLAGAGYRRDNAPGPGVTLWSIDSRQPQFLQFGWREKVRILDLQRGMRSTRSEPGGGQWTNQEQSILIIRLGPFGWEGLGMRGERGGLFPNTMTRALSSIDDKHNHTVLHENEQGKSWWW